MDHQLEESNGSSNQQRRIPPRQGWTELPPPDPEIRLDPSRLALMSPSSGESSSSPIEGLDRTDAQSLDELSQLSKPYGQQQYGNLSQQQARQRIREKTKTMVEKQRRMAKTMARTQSQKGGASMEWKMPNEGDQEQKKEIIESDHQIEESIKIGADYVEGQFGWGRQLESGDQSEADMLAQQQPIPLLLLAQARTHTLEEEAKFHKMIVWKGANGGQRLGLHHPEDMEKGLQAKREQSANQQEEQQKKPTMGLIVPHDDSSNNIPPQLFWRDPLPWRHWLEQSGTRRWAAQRPTGLWLDLQGIEFDHHWLFTRAEAVQRELFGAFDCWAEVHQQMLGAVKEWLAFRQKMSDQQEGQQQQEEEEGMGEEEERKEGIKEEEGEEENAVNNLETLFSRILDFQAGLDRCRAALERAWAESDQTRGRFLLERLEGHAEVFEEESEGGVPEQLRAFFRSPLYMLSERDQEERMASIPEFEKQRRAAVANCRYQVQVFFNELLVSSTEECPLEWPSFSVSFGQIYPIRVFERPEHLRLALREHFGRGPPQPIADIFVPFPGEEEEVEEEDEGKEKRKSNHQKEEAQKKWTPKTGLQFASTAQRGSHKGSLGCGQGGVPFMQGRLFATLRCQRENGDSNIKGGNASIERLRLKSRRDLAPLSKASLFPSGTVICPEETLQSDLRLLALEKRWRERKEKDGKLQRPIELKMPNEYDGGSAGIIDEIDSFGREDMEMPTGRGAGKHRRSGEMELEMRRRLGRKFAKALRNHLRESGEQRRRAQDIGELVRQDPVPQINLAIFSFLFANRQMDVSRRLKPIRNNPTAAPIGGRSFMESSRIVLNIQHASDIPPRANNDEPIQLFLLCTIRKQSQATSLVDGRHANWQETLVLDWPAAAVPSQTEEDLFLEVELFDREVRQMEEDDRRKDTRHERMEKRWIGSARVPLNGLQAVGKLDGHLALTSPIFHTGYKFPPDGGMPTTIRMLISLDPPPMVLPSPLPLPTLPTTAAGNVDEQNCHQFETRLRQRFPNRRVITVAIDSSGKRIIAHRFLRRIVPPPQVTNLQSANQPQKAVKLAAQMVASLPTFHDFLENGSGGGGHLATPIWSLANEILQIGVASPEEQGILLCCWLLGLHLSSVLLLGTGFPNGPNSAFVLVQFADGQHWLINPTTAHHFVPSDGNSPLLSVGTVLTMDNIYVNVQPREHPSQLDFDLRKRAHWEALFPEGRKDLLPSIQPETLRYGPVEENWLMELRTGLEREIRLEFDQQRPFAIPQWNLLASRSLRELLADSWADLLPPSVPQLQIHQSPSASAVNISSSSSNSPPPPPLQIDSHLAHLRPAFHLSAFAFRAPFISRAQIIRQVLRTMAHTNSEPQAQFALAVHLKPFFGTLFSCSIAICTLLPQQSTTNINNNNGSR